MEDIVYNVIRTKRSTIAVYIREDGSVEVRAPFNTDDAYIEDFIRRKSDWIRSHSKTRAENNELKRSFCPYYGDKLLYRGTEYPISKCEGSRAGFDGNAFLMPDYVPKERFAEILVEIYKKLAKKYIPLRVEHYSRIMGLVPTAVKISSANTRWGSCSGRDSINFAWKLIMASDELIDYVVVHELAHIKEHNHSDRFWNIVESIMPDYRQRMAAFDELTERLRTENWD